MTGVVVSSGFVLSEGGDFNADSPIVGYHNLVPDASLSATTEDPDHPVSNLANPATHLRWRAGAGSPSSEEYITVIFNEDESVEDVDYLAIARHNLGTSQAVVSVEGTETEPGSPEDWFELVSERLLPNNNPTIFRFTKQPLYAVRLRIQESQAATPETPYIAVMYVGALLLLQRRIYVGHTPITYGRGIKVANHRSIDGHFVGRIVLSEMRETTVDLKNLTPDWVRDELDPFIQDAQVNPFFFGWRPGSYPYEAGYAWLTNDPKPQNQLANGMMQVSFELEGIA